MWVKYMSKTSTFSFFKIIGDSVLDKPIEQFLDTSIKTLIDSSCVLRESIGEERIYYCGNDKAYSITKDKGREAKWLHDFFNNINSVLCAKGFKQKFGEEKKNINFLEMTAREVLTLLKACNILNAEII